MAKKNNTRSSKGSKDQDYKRNNAPSRDTAKRNKSNGETNDTLGGSAYSGNDISWYKRYASMVDSAAHLAFPYVPGRVLEVDGPAIPDAEDYIDAGFTPEAVTNWKYPGILAFNFYPSVGRSLDITSPINVAAREIYGKIRSKYSGALEADAPDIMMYIIAVDSLFMLIEDMKRAYYLINQYTPYNNYFPQAVIKALGYDFDDLMENKMLFEQYIQEAIAIASKFSVPDIMDLTKRHQFMCANIYADQPLLKSQNYIFKLGGVYKVAETDTMTKCEITTRAEQFMTVRDTWAWFKECVDALTEWDTSYTILGYLMRAFESNSFIVPAPLTINGVLNPMYNADMLLQIQNANAVQLNVKTLAITQDPTNGNTLYSNPQQYRVTGVDDIIPCAGKESLMTVPGDGQPSTDVVIYASRLSALCDGSDIYCATEVIDSIEYYEHVSGVPQYIWNSNWNVIGRPSTEDATRIRALTSAVKFMMLLEAFDRHPTFAFVIPQSSSGKMPITFSIGAENVTTVGKDFLDNLHRMCIYSEFNCFGIISNG